MSPFKTVKSLINSALSKNQYIAIPLKKMKYLLLYLVIIKSPLVFSTNNTPEIMR